MLFDRQGGRCAICGNSETTPATSRHKGNLGRPRRLAVDHDHTSGLVRGLLCTRCNMLLGFSLDNPSVLLRAAEYLEFAGVNAPEGSVDCVHPAASRWTDELTGDVACGLCAETITRIWSGRGSLRSA